MSGANSPLARGIFRTGLLIAAAAGAVAWRFRGPAFAVSLTATSLVAIVHLLWIDRLLGVIFSGESPRLRRWDSIKILGHFLLLTALAAAAYLWPAFSPLGAAIGVTAVVVAVAFEGLRTTSAGEGPT